jgi:hypothetical protein
MITFFLSGSSIPLSAMHSNTNDLLSILFNCEVSLSIIFPENHKLIETKVSFAKIYGSDLLYQSI